MTIRQAAGLEPMQPAMRLHGCERVGNTREIAVSSESIGRQAFPAWALTFRDWSVSVPFFGIDLATQESHSAAVVVSAELSVEDRDRIREEWRRLFAGGFGALYSIEQQSAGPGRPGT